MITKTTKHYNNKKILQQQQFQQKQQQQPFGNDTFFGLFIISIPSSYSNPVGREITLQQQPKDKCAFKTFNFIIVIFIIIVFFFF